MITVPIGAKTVTFSQNVGDGYDFVAGHPYDIKWFEGHAMIFNPDEIILNNGEVTEDVLKLAVFE